VAEEKVEADRILGRYGSLREVMLDRDLAKLGDAYLNFVHSLALSQRLGRPAGEKVDNQTLASALRKTDLRGILPRRTDRHAQGNAAEALIAYAWLRKALTIEDCLGILRTGGDPVEAFAELLGEAEKRLSRLHEAP